MPTPQITGEYLAISSIRRTTPTDVSYTVEVTSNFAGWHSGPAFTTQTSVTSINVTTERATIRDITLSSAAKWFIRVKLGYQS